MVVMNNWVTKSFGSVSASLQDKCSHFLFKVAQGLFLCCHYHVCFLDYNFLRAWYWVGMLMRRKRTMIILTYIETKSILKLITRCFQRTRNRKQVHGIIWKTISLIQRINIFWCIIGFEKKSSNEEFDVVTFWGRETRTPSLTLVAFCLLWNV